MIIGGAAMYGDLLTAHSTPVTNDFVVKWDERFAQQPDVSLYCPLIAIAPGPTRVVRTSISLGWRGILLEKHFSSKGERRAASIDRHVISLLCTHSARFDYRAPSGRWVPFVQARGTLTVTPSGPVPDVQLQTEAVLLHCAFEDHFIQNVVNEMDCRPNAPAFCPGLSDSPMQRIIGLLLDELETDAPNGAMYVDSLAHALATRYILLDSRSSAWSDSQPSALPARILNRVQEKIQANLHTELRLETLAQESGYSRAHFLRMFRVAVGVTPHQYILTLRLHRAQEFLRQKSQNLIDIAALCGFASQSHMTSVFRKHLSVTPAEYRRNT